MTVSSEWGPDRQKGAISITLDNMGSIADKAAGLPILTSKNGRHISLEILPDVLACLKGIEITYFIEAWNCIEHPDEIAQVTDAGHQVGVHAWKHENWAKLPKDQRLPLMQKSVNAFREMGVAVKSFRPPGGVCPVDELLADCARCELPFASFVGKLGCYRQENGVIGLPFTWHHVDAYLLHPDLGRLRSTFGDREEPYSPEDWQNQLEHALQTAKQRRIHVTLIFHPVIIGRDVRYLEILSSFVKTAKQDPDIWLAPLDEAAKFWYGCR